MKHLINATNKPIKLENGQHIFPGQHYVKVVEDEVEKAVEEVSSKFDELMKLTRDELKQKAEELGLEVKTSAKKEDIVKAIDEGADDK